MLRQFALNNLALVLQYAVSGLVPLLLIPHIVRELGLAQFGALAIALAWANYGALTVQYAFHLSGPRRLAQLSARETALEIVCRIGSAKLVLLGAVGVALAIGALAAAAVGHPVSVPQVLLLVLVPVGAALHTGWHLQAAGRFAAVSALSMLGVILAMVTGLTGVAAHAPGALLLAALALGVGPLWTGASTLAASMRLLSHTHEGAGRRAGWRTPWAELREGWPLFASQLTSALYTASGPIVVGLLAGVEEAGAYSAVERVTTAVGGACLLVHTAAYPKLAELYSRDRRAYLRLLRIVLTAYISLTGMVAIGAVLAWQPILHFLLGAAGGSYGPMLAAGLVWVLLGIFGTILTGYLTVRGEGDRVLPLTARVLALSFLLGIPGVLVWGSWAWMAALCTAQVLVLAAGWRAWQAETRSGHDVQRAQ